MKALDLSAPFRLVTEAVDLTEEDQERLKAAETVGELSHGSSPAFPVCASVIAPGTGYVYRPLHFKTRDDAIEFYKDSGLTITLGERLKIR